MPSGSGAPNMGPRRPRSTLPAQRLAGRKIEEMNPRARGTGESLNASPFDSLLLFQVSLHIHACMGASKNNKIGHRNGMAIRCFFIFDIDQFWNRLNHICTAVAAFSGAR